MKGQPLFTVATITYNSGKWIRQAIDSVLASSYSDFEFIISDDNSNDNTRKIIQEYNDPRIRVFQNEENTGEYQNRNKVLSEAAGKYILFVDGDDVLYKYSLRNLSEYVLAFPEAGMIWGLNPQHFPFFIFPYLVQPEVNMQLIYRTPIPISNIGFGEIVFRTDVLRAAGGFVLKYKTGDTYIKKKIAMTTPVLYAPIGFIFWRQSSGQASKNIKGMHAMLDRFAIDNEILCDPRFPGSLPDRGVIEQNIRISQTKIFFSATVMKGRFLSFFKYASPAGFTFSRLKYLFQKGDYSYSPSPELGEPLYNNFNFLR